MFSESIVGVGIDIVANDRVRRLFSRHADRFLERCFTSAEVSYCRSRRDPVPDLAVRLAAKEACFKAIGGRRKMGLAWRDFEVVLDHEGVPSMRLHGKADNLGRALCIRRIWLSLSHEIEWSAAVVVVTAASGHQAQHPEH